MRLVTADSPEALAALSPQHGPPACRRGDEPVPGVQCGIGPATDEGFFYDFVVSRPFVPEDLEPIEKKMRELAQQDLPSSGRCGRARKRSGSSALAASR